MKKALRYLVLSALGAVFLIPFLWMLSTSLTPAAEVMAKHRSWIPTHPQWSNYPEALTVLPFQIFLKNTLIVTVLAIIGQVRQRRWWRSVLPGCASVSAMLCSCWLSRR